MHPFEILPRVDGLLLVICSFVLCIFGIWSITNSKYCITVKNWFAKKIPSITNSREIIFSNLPLIIFRSNIHLFECMTYEVLFFSSFCIHEYFIFYKSFFSSKYDLHRYRILARTPFLVLLEKQIFLFCSKTNKFYSKAS